MELAKKMLLDPSRTIKGIATALDYRDVQNFTIAYKRYYNQVPTDMRTDSLT
jgi:AraC-like DNA-binding protein